MQYLKPILLSITILLFNGCVSKSPIHNAAKNGDIHSIKEFLKNGGDIEAPPPKHPWTGFYIWGGNKPLHMAVEASQKEAVNYLLSKNANIEAKNSNGETPLLLSAKYGLLDISKLLLQKDANIFAKNDAGDTVLHTTLKNFKNQKNKALLNATFYINQKASINVQNNWGDTPSHLASKYNLIEVIKLLEKNNALLSIKNNYGNTPIFLTLNTSFIPYSTLNSKAFEYLINKNLNFKDKNKKKQTLLHRTCNPKYIEQLIKKGISINEEDKDGYTPPFLAIRTCSKEAIIKYLENGFNIKSINKKGESPLFVALSNPYFQEELIQTLIKYKADIHQKDKKGNSILHKASTSNPKIIDLILSKGVDINIKTKVDSTPLHRASSVRVSYKKGTDPTLEAFKYLLSKENIDLNVQDKRGCTPLIRAISNGNFQKAKLLIKKGANPNLKENRGHTALDIAILSKNKQKQQLIKLLKNYGAITNINPNPKKSYSIICSYP